MNNGMTENVILYFIAVIAASIGFAYGIVILGLAGAVFAVWASGYVGMLIGKPKGLGGVGIALGVMAGMFGWLLTAILAMAVQDA